jgi:tetratricopeptide (TPR) repeat protein
MIFAAAASLMLLAPAPAAISPEYEAINSTEARACSQAAVAGVTAATKDAIEACTRALDTEPLSRFGMAVTYQNRGILRLMRNDHDGAIKDFNSAIEEEPSLASAYVNRGATFLAMHSHNAALRDAERAMQLAPKNARAVLLRGGVLETMGKTKEAYRDYQAAAKLDPAWQRPKEELARFKVK